MEVLCGILFLAVAVLSAYVYVLRRTAAELVRQVGERIEEDTNVGIDISSSDPYMRRLAAELDVQLKLLRREHHRYTRGDQELKHAITNISHDLRTPLTAICGYMDLLRQEDTSETVREYLSIVENRVTVLKNLTEELFRYSVVMSVDSCMEREPVSLNRVLEESIAAYYTALMEAGIEPEIVMPGKEVRRVLNAQAFSRILSNLISNALKYSDGDLRVILTEEGTLSFENHASRLDEVQVGNLFDRFYTVESGQNSTGLGLSIARTLTEELGGRIAAEYQEGILRIVLSFPDRREAHFKNIEGEHNRKA
ncbi:MAG: HAMP domain-containing sensor histidine kinase [Lachnospiraceae bacterium]|nr:HAMP domain-containing sensor histidine kinase [Lachnospiraceae bacterium]